MFGVGRRDVEKPAARCHNVAATNTFILSSTDRPAAKRVYPGDKQQPNLYQLPIGQRQQGADGQRGMHDKIRRLDSVPTVGIFQGDVWWRVED